MSRLKQSTEVQVTVWLKVTIHIGTVNMSRLKQSTEVQLTVWLKVTIHIGAVNMSRLRQTTHEQSTDWLKHTTQGHLICSIYSKPSGTIDKDRLQETPQGQ